MKDKIKVQNFYKYLVSLFIILVVIGPLLVVLFTSFKTKEHMVTVSPLLLPPVSEITLENYKEVFTSKYLPTAIKNTILILVVSLAFNVILGSITAYILERFQFRFKKFVVSLFFLGMMVPSFVMEISRFKVIRNRQTSGRKKRPPPQRPGFEMAVRDSIRF